MSCGTVMSLESIVIKELSLNIIIAYKVLLLATYPIIVPKNLIKARERSLCLLSVEWIESIMAWE